MPTIESTAGSFASADSRLVPTLPDAPVTTTRIMACGYPLRSRRNLLASATSIWMTAGDGPSGGAFTLTDRGRTNPQNTEPAESERDEVHHSKQYHAERSTAGVFRPGRIPHRRHPVAQGDASRRRRRRGG